MTTLNRCAFRIAFNGDNLVANPTGNESLYDAMIRTIGKHTGSPVSQTGHCKKRADGKYSYPNLVCENGTLGEAVILGNA